MKIAQILVAAGKSARFGGSLPKQYHRLGSKTVIEHTLSKVYESNLFDQIVVVVADGDTFITDIVASFSPAPVIVTGGKTRTASVKAGLEALASNPPDLVLIHDAARPFVSTDLMSAVINTLSDSQAVVPILPMIDAVKSFSDGQVGADLDRQSMLRVQTPQGFRFSDFWPLYQNLSDQEHFADDIALAEHAGLSIHTVMGNENNFKITHKDDLLKAERLMTSSFYTATGHGFDVHRIEPGKSLWLAGIEIPAGFSLKGHSDADVGLHAITDAILGALAEGDIGDHFPPTDPKWKGARSDQFLSFARDRVIDRNGKLAHIDLTLICEKPKVKPYRESMRQRIAEILGISINRVSVKATTTEKLGYTGRGEGISAHAIASIVLPDV